MKKQIRVAVCGELPTACECLLKNGVVKIDRFSDATEIQCEAAYHLILVHAPCGEGLLNTQYSRSDLFETEAEPIPVRLLGEPCCPSALVELRSIIRRIEQHLKEKRSDAVRSARFDYISEPS